MGRQRCGHSRHRMIELCAPGGEAVDGRCLSGPVTVATEVIASHRIEGDEKKIPTGQAARLHAILKAVE